MDDEEPDHDDGGPARGFVVRPVVLVLCCDDGLEKQKVSNRSEIRKNESRDRKRAKKQKRRGKRNELTIIMWHVAMPMAPIIKVGLRPHLSTHMTAGIVAMNMTIPTTPVANKLTALESRPKFLKIVGA
jgi:hypothetical protein